MFNKLVVSSREMFTLAIGIIMVSALLAGCVSLPSNGSEQVFINEDGKYIVRSEDANPLSMELLADTTVCTKEQLFAGKKKMGSKIDK